MAKKILVETSARHVHLSDEHLKVLFGADAVLHKKKDLSQPGQFASEERVDVVGPRRLWQEYRFWAPPESRPRLSCL